MGIAIFYKMCIVFILGLVLVLEEVGGEVGTLSHTYPVSETPLPPHSISQLCSLGLPWYHRQYSAHTKSLETSNMGQNLWKNIVGIRTLIITISGPYLTRSQIVDQSIFLFRTSREDSLRVQLPLLIFGTNHKRFEQSSTK